MGPPWSFVKVRDLQILRFAMNNDFCGVEIFVPPTQALLGWGTTELGWATTFGAIP
jgi:hypothetical protein